MHPRSTTRSRPGVPFALGVAFFAAACAGGTTPEATTPAAPGAAYPETRPEPRRSTTADPRGTAVDATTVTRPATPGSPGSTTSAPVTGTTGVTPAPGRSPAGPNTTAAPSPNASGKGATSAQQPPVTPYKPGNQPAKPPAIGGGPSPSTGGAVFGDGDEGNTGTVEGGDDDPPRE